MLLGTGKLTTGESTYMVYKSGEQCGSPSQLFLLNTYITPGKHDNETGYVIEQRWQMDTLFYNSVTFFSKASLSTIYHSYWWKHKSYRVDHDYKNKTVSYKGEVSDASLQADDSALEAGFKEYGYNWYNDLLLFPFLPYKPNTVFAVNFNDPGCVDSGTQYYKVDGTEILNTSAGEQLPCWILKHRPPAATTDYRKFWILKSTGQVLKQEDYVNGMYRFRVRLLVLP